MVASGCRPFLYAIGPFVLQVMTLILMITDTLQYGSKYNSLNLPVDVSVAVRLAQVIALLITVVTQGDVIVALSQLADGYNTYAMTSLQDSFPDLSRVKWAASVVCRLIVGMMVLFVAFLLVVQQDNVVEIFLNFLAISFVSEIDDIFFILALRGFGGDKMGEVARNIESSYFSSSTTSGGPNPAACKCKIRRWSLMMMILLLMMGSLGWAFRQQTSGDLLTRDIIVQFDDTFEPALGAFSGVYSLRKAAFGTRAKYIEERSGKAMLGYCDSIQAWTFTFGNNTLDPCDNIRARSSETVSYDIMSTDLSTWFDVDPDRGDLPIMHFFMTSYDCRDKGICGSHGTCMGWNGCLCDDGWFGLRCEFPSPCPTIERDE